MSEIDWSKVHADLDTGLEIVGLNIQNAFRRGMRLPELTLEESRERRRQTFLSAMESIEEITEETDVMADYVDYLRREGQSE